MYMAKTDKILVGSKPNVTHPQRPKAGKQMFHPCSIIPMNLIIGLLLYTQFLAANERGVGMQSSLICTIVYIHLKPHETSLVCVVAHTCPIS